MVALNIIALPLLFLLSFKQKYRQSLKKRFLLPSFPKTQNEIIWIHACSFGEIRAIKPLIEKINLNNNESIIITTTTQTGYNEANKIFQNAQVYYLPFESFIPLFTKNLKIKTLTLFEAELWLMPLVCAKQKQATTILLNARISTNSYDKYLKFSFLYKVLFSYVDLVLAQQNIDKQRLQSIGARNIEICGNIKASQKPQITKDYKKPKQELWIVASTHEKQGILEEEIILQEILKILEISDSSPRILFVPRHPERFSKVQLTLENILKAKNLELKIASKEGIQNTIQAQFGLIDCLGELNNLYAISSLVILGGSFVDKVGGHNPIEPSFFNNKLITGAYIFNQTALFSLLQNYVICDIKDLSVVLKYRNLLEDSKTINKIKLDKIAQKIQGQ